MNRDNFDQGSDELDQMYCEFCKTKGRSCPSDGFCVDCIKYFCSRCLECHSEFLPTHIQKDKQTMPQEICVKPCLVHGNEIIKFYCPACEDFFCYLCRQTNHLKCSGIKHLPEFVEKIDIQAKYRDETEMVQKILIDMKEKERSFQEKMTDIDDYAFTAKEAVSAQKAEVFACIEEHFANLYEEIAEIQRKDKSDVDSEKAELESLINQAEKLKTDLETQMTANRCELFMLLKQAEGKRQAIQACQKGMKIRQVTRYEFQASYGVNKVLCELSLGECVRQTTAPDKQKFIVSEGFKKPLVEGDVWYVVSKGWWKKLESYVAYEDSQSTNEASMGEAPGPIDNSDIVTENSLKEHLIDDLDYVLVPSILWDQMVEWYGMVPGQKPLPRKVISEGVYNKSLKVEVYPWYLKLSEGRNQDKQVVECFSRSSTIGELEDKIRELFDIPYNRPVRLWNRYMTNMYEQLKQRDKTLQDAGLYLGQMVVIEQQNLDGTWPLDGLLP